MRLPTYAKGQLLALDPGPLKTGWVLWDGLLVNACGIDANHDVIPEVSDWAGPMAIEMIASYGMPVGAEVFDTCVWIGRFIQAHRRQWHALVFRKDVKMNLCGTTRAKDANIRQALLDRCGPVGTAKVRGPLYGVKSHMWAALGVAVTAYPQVVP